MRRLLLALLAVPLALGCTSFLHFSDPTLQSVSCVLSGALLPELEALAAAAGIPLEELTALYADGCDLAAAQGMSQADAEKAGLQHVKEGVSRLKSLGAHFSGDGGAP